MIRLEIAPLPPERGLEEQIGVAEFVDQLVGDKRFMDLMTHAADGCVHEWSIAQSEKEREEKWFTLQGLQRLLREMQKEIEHGAAARDELIARKRQAAAREGARPEQPTTQTP
jgi:hypothetical protein